MNRTHVPEVRKLFVWFGWSALVALPIIFAIEIMVIQDLPHVQPWKWAILVGAVVMLYLARDRDDALKHHVV